MKKEWYVVNTVSGYEYKVKEKLEMMIVNSPEIQESIFRVIVPEQTIVEFKDGVKKEKIKKMFPGYVLVEMIMTDEVWFIVRNTQGVTGFIGSSGKGAKPIPLMPDEVDRILSSMGMSRIDIAKDLAEGKKVKITDGPFKNMIGKISSYDIENKKVEVLLDLFGQETSVEVSLAEIENLK
jgi:transcriptional antiterminator NusG